MVKNSPAMQDAAADVGSIPGSGRSPRGGHGNPFQYPCLEKPMGRGAWRATVHRITKSYTCRCGLIENSVSLDPVDHTL